MELNMNKFIIAEIIEYIESYVDCTPRQCFGFLTVSDVKKNLLANQYTFEDALIDLLKEKNVSDSECYKTMGITSFFTRLLIILLYKSCVILLKILVISVINTLL